MGIYRFRWSLDSALPVIATAQQIAQDTLNDKRFHLRLGIGTKGLTRTQIHADANVNAIGQYYGTVEELRAILAPLLEIGTAEERARNSASVREVTPGEASVLLSATTPVERFAAKSAILHSRTLLTDQQVSAAAERLLDWPGSGNEDGAGFAMFALGGEINRVPPNATAFVHRNGLFVFAAETSWADYDHPGVAEANLHWLKEFYAGIFRDRPPEHAYQNFPDPTLKEWRRAYYGANYPRLVRVKQKYDPTGFFSYPQAIGTEVSELTRQSRRFGCGLCAVSVTGRGRPVVQGPAGEGAVRAVGLVRPGAAGDHAAPVGDPGRVRVLRRGPYPHVDRSLHRGPVPAVRAKAVRRPGRLHGRAADGDPRPCARHVPTTLQEQHRSRSSERRHNDPSSQEGIHWAVSVPARSSRPWGCRTRRRTQPVSTAAAATA